MLPSARDKVQDFPCECDYDTAGKRKEPVGALAWVVAFKAQTNLNNAECQKYHAYGADKSEYKLG